MGKGDNGRGRKKSRNSPPSIPGFAPDGLCLILTTSCIVLLCILHLFFLFLPPQKSNTMCRKIQG